jgi:hypothetical protein
MAVRIHDGPDLFLGGRFETTRQARRCVALFRCVSRESQVRALTRLCFIRPRSFDFRTVALVSEQNSVTLKSLRKTRSESRAD